MICQRSQVSSGLELGQKPAPLLADQGSLHCPMLPHAALLCMRTVLGPDTVLVDLDRDGGYYRALALSISRAHWSDVRAGKALTMPLRMGRLRPEKGKGLFKAPGEVMAGSRLEPRSPDPQPEVGSGPFSLQL